MSLTTTMGVKLGPIVLGTLFKHYLERHNVTRDSKARDELLFDEAFIIVKSFLEESTKHTVEELQQFSNTRIPSPPWVHCVRVLIPLSCCDEAAPLLLKALGGPDAVGGSKWWQVRGVRGVDAQWVAVKRDWREAERRRKQRQGEPTSPQGPSTRRNSIRAYTGFRRESAPDLRRAKSTRPSTAHGATSTPAREYLSPRRPATSSGRSSNPHSAPSTPELASVHEPSKSDSALETDPPKSAGESEAHYEPEMDDMRCMLYIHGGGYYFGSVDQQRFCVQRYARKMGGRVFAVNYRLAPQYPFPCALQDCLAAYLYLIRPPPGAEHLPVPPNMLIIAGDSAGGGMTLALLQIIRDVGLPAPAGGILISPWCDLTHSFPSILTNTATDIIPPYGLSLHKPSTLWPPPSEELTAELRGRMTRGVREVVRRGKSKLGLGTGGESEIDLAKLVAENSHKAEETKTKPGLRSRSLGHEAGRWWRRRRPSATDQAETARGNSGVPLERSRTYAPTVEGGTVPAPPRLGDMEIEVAPENVPLPPSPDDPAPLGQASQQTSPRLNTKKPPKRQSTADPSRGPIQVEVDGQMRTVRSQIQLYAQNHQLTHPLVSPALGYLGGLPPLFVLASDKEVLRDEIIYVAHKAAHPERYPLKPETKELLPLLNGIEEKGYPPTLVHLQVYDETCHVLPLFSFTTPAKYCYRAIALFCKHVTRHVVPSVPPTPVLPEGQVTHTPEMEPAPDPTSTSNSPPRPPRASRRMSLTSPKSLTFSPSLLRRSTSKRPAITVVNPNANPTTPTSPVREPSDDIAGPRFNLDKNEPPTGVGTAGDPSVYGLQSLGQPGFESPFKDNMIRERVSTAGVLRPLEPENDLVACQMPLENIGVINASAVKRYLQGQALWDTKFAGVLNSIARARVKHLKLARKEGRKSMGALHGALTSGMLRDEQASSSNRSPSSSVTFLGSSNWSMSWALEGENPPPSSIVSRRDTAEARQLAICADRDLGEDSESKMSGNNLWSIVVDFLSQNPDRNAKPTDPLVVDAVDIHVQPPTPAPASPVSPKPPILPAPTLSKRRSSGFLRKLMGRDSTSESTSRRPLSLFIDSSRNSGLPMLDKP